MKVAPSVLGQFLHMKTHLPGLVDSGEHAGSHARVIMIGGGTDQSDLMAQFLEVGEILKGGQMGMSPTDKNQVFTHRKHHPLSSSTQQESKHDSDILYAIAMAPPFLSHPFSFSNSPVSV